MVKEGTIRHIDDFDVIMEKTDQKIDLKGKFVLPGFIDSHTHLLEEGLREKWVNLYEEDSIEGVQYYLEKRALETPPGEWVVGVDFDESKWKKTKSPSKKDLDEVSEEHPIVIKRICDHAAVANSLALEKIDDDWEMTDEETGVLKEDVVRNLNDIIGVDEEEKIEAIKTAIEKVHANGITSIHDIVDKDVWNLYKKLDDEDQLDLRINCYIHHEVSKGLKPMDYSEFLSLKGIKVLTDGSIGARTAALHEDYSDNPGNRGTLLLSKNELEEIIKDAEERDFQVMTHAIGDRAISTVLDAFENASTRTDELRHRIEHAEILWEEDIKKIRELGLILSTQPNYAYKWSSSSEMNETRLGKRRLEKSNPYWDIQRSLVEMAFGSDNIFLSPLFNIHCATNHPILNQRISTYNALKSYTSSGAYASREEEKLGSFEEGKAADFVVLSDNPLEVNDVRDIEILMTVIGGKIVFDNRED